MHNAIAFLGFAFEMLALAGGLTVVGYCLIKFVRHSRGEAYKAANFKARAPRRA